MRRGGPLFVGVEQMAACQPHKLEVAGSSPAPGPRLSRVEVTPRAPLMAEAAAVGVQGASLPPVGCLGCAGTPESQATLPRRPQRVICGQLRALSKLRCLLGLRLGRKAGRPPARFRQAKPWPSPQRGVLGARVQGGGHCDKPQLRYRAAASWQADGGWYRVPHHRCSRAYLSPTTWVRGRCGPARWGAAPRMRRRRFKSVWRPRIHLSATDNYNHGPGAATPGATFTATWCGPHRQGEAGKGAAWCLCCLKRDPRPAVACAVGAVD